MDYPQAIVGGISCALVWRARRAAVWRARRAAAVGSLVDRSDYLDVVSNPWWIKPCDRWVEGGGPKPLAAAGAEQHDSPPLPFGRETRAAHFLLEPLEKLAFLNHGSYGATLREAFEAKEWWLRRMEAEPVRFMDDEVLPALASAQRALARFVHAAPRDLVLVPNATTAVNAVVRSLRLRPGDVLLSLDIAYDACKSALDYAARRAGARLVRVRVPWPMEDDAVVAAVRCALDAEAARGAHVAFALFDHVTSCPAVLMPVQRLCALCRARGVPVMVDGAHAVGGLELDVPAVGADAYTSNCHKWLCTPKGTAFLWVRAGPLQRLVRPTVTSHGYGLGFVREFMWAATCDYTPFLGIEPALAFFERRGGVRAIAARNHALAQRGGALLARAWGTEPLVGARHCTTMCVVRAPEGVYSPAQPADPQALCHALRARGVEVPVFAFRDALYVRVSAQVYNELEEYERLAALMLELQHGARAK
eukprot:g1798.t1